MTDRARYGLCLICRRPQDLVTKGTTTLVLCVVHGPVQEQLRLVEEARRVRSRRGRP
jgi:hypothetical protein